MADGDDRQPGRRGRPASKSTAAKKTKKAAPTKKAVPTEKSTTKKSVAKKSATKRTAAPKRAGARGSVASPSIEEPTGPGPGAAPTPPSPQTQPGAAQTQPAAVPPGPGYWQASDGNWYPPHTAPAPQWTPTQPSWGPGPVPPPATPRSSNKGCLIAALIVGGLALVLVIGAVIAASQGVKKVSKALTIPTAVTTPGTGCGPFTYPDKQATDHCAPPGGQVADFGQTVTASQLRRESNALGPQICADVTYVNRTAGTKSFNQFDWKLQAPSGAVQSFDITNATLGSGQLVSGGTKAGTVCFRDTGERGQFVLIWKPEPFRSDRGIWVQTL